MGNLILRFLLAFSLVSTSLALNQKAKEDKSLLFSLLQKVENTFEVPAGCSRMCSFNTTGVCQHPERGNNVCSEKTVPHHQYMVCPSGMINCGRRPSYTDPMENYDANSIPSPETYVSASITASNFPSVSSTSTPSPAEASPAHAGVATTLTMERTMIYNTKYGNDYNLEPEVYTYNDHVPTADELLGADAVFDGDVSTVWNPAPCPMGGGIHYWFDFNLKEVRTISQVMLQGTGDGYHDVDYFTLRKSTDDGATFPIEVQGWNGVIRESGEQWFDVSEPVTLQYGRIYIYSTFSDYQPIIAEVTFKELL